MYRGQLNDVNTCKLDEKLRRIAVIRTKFRTVDFDFWRLFDFSTTFFQNLICDTRGKKHPTEAPPPMSICGEFKINRKFFSNKLTNGTFSEGLWLVKTL